jgi:hypothetical protein
VGWLSAADAVDVVVELALGAVADELMLESVVVVVVVEFVV